MESVSKLLEAFSNVDRKRSAPLNQQEGATNHLKFEYRWRLKSDLIPELSEEKEGEQNAKDKNAPKLPSKARLITAVSIVHRVLESENVPKNMLDAWLNGSTFQDSRSSQGADSRKRSADAAFTEDTTSGPSPVNSERRSSQSIPKKFDILSFNGILRDVIRSILTIVNHMDIVTLVTFISEAEKDFEGISGKTAGGDSGGKQSKLYVAMDGTNDMDLKRSTNFQDNYMSTLTKREVQFDKVAGSNITTCVRLLSLAMLLERTVRAMVNGKPGELLFERMAANLDEQPRETHGFNPLHELILLRSFISALFIAVLNKLKELEIKDDGTINNLFEKGVSEQSPPLTRIIVGRHWISNARKKKTGKKDSWKVFCPPNEVDGKSSLAVLTHLVSSSISNILGVPMMVQSPKDAKIPDLIAAHNVLINRMTVLSLACFSTFNCQLEDRINVGLDTLQWNMTSDVERDLKTNTTPTKEKLGSSVHLLLSSKTEKLEKNFMYDLNKTISNLVLVSFADIVSLDRSGNPVMDLANIPNNQSNNNKAIIIPHSTILQVLDGYTTFDANDNKRDHQFYLNEKTQVKGMKFVNRQLVKSYLSQQLSRLLLSKRYFNTRVPVLEYSLDEIFAYAAGVIRGNMDQNKNSTESKLASVIDALDDTRLSVSSERKTYFNDLSPRVGGLTKFIYSKMSQLYTKDTDVKVPDMTVKQEIFPLSQNFTHGAGFKLISSILNFKIHLTANQGTLKTENFFSPQLRVALAVSINYFAENYVPGNSFYKNGTTKIQRCNIVDSNKKLCITLIPDTNEFEISQFKKNVGYNKFLDGIHSDSTTRAMNIMYFYFRRERYQNQLFEVIEDTASQNDQNKKLNFWEPKLKQMINIMDLGISGNVISMARKIIISATQDAQRKKADSQPSSGFMRNQHVKSEDGTYERTSVIEIRIEEGVNLNFEEIHLSIDLIQILCPSLRNPKLLGMETKKNKNMQKVPPFNRNTSFAEDESEMDICCDKCNCGTFYDILSVGKALVGILPSHPTDTVTNPVESGNDFDTINSASLFESSILKCITAIINFWIDRLNYIATLRKNDWMGKPSENMQVYINEVTINEFSEFLIFALGKISCRLAPLDKTHFENYIKDNLESQNGNSILARIANDYTVIVDACAAIEILYKVVSRYNLIIKERYTANGGKPIISEFGLTFEEEVKPFYDISPVIFTCFLTATTILPLSGSISARLNEYDRTVTDEELNFDGIVRSAPFTISYYFLLRFIGQFILPMMGKDDNRMTSELLRMCGAELMSGEGTLMEHRRRCTYVRNDGTKLFGDIRNYNESNDTGRSDIQISNYLGLRASSELTSRSSLFDGIITGSGDYMCECQNESESELAEQSSTLAEMFPEDARMQRFGLGESYPGLILNAFDIFLTYVCSMFSRKLPQHPFERNFAESNSLQKLNLLVANIDKYSKTIDGGNKSLAFMMYQLKKLPKEPFKEVDFAFRSFRYLVSCAENERVKVFWSMHGYTSAILDHRIFTDVLINPSMIKRHNLEPSTSEPQGQGTDPFKPALSTERKLGLMYLKLLSRLLQDSVVRLRLDESHPRQNDFPTSRGLQDDVDSESSVTYELWCVSTMPITLYLMSILVASHIRFRYEFTKAFNKLQDEGLEDSEPNLEGCVHSLKVIENTLLLLQVGGFFEWDIGTTKNIQMETRQMKPTDHSDTTLRRYFNGNKLVFFNYRLLKNLYIPEEYHYGEDYDYTLYLTNEFQETNQPIVRSSSEEDSALRKSRYVSFLNWTTKLCLSLNEAKLILYSKFSNGDSELFEKNVGISNFVSCVDKVLTLSTNGIHKYVNYTSFAYQQVTSLVKNGNLEQSDLDGLWDISNYRMLSKCSMWDHKLVKAVVEVTVIPINHVVNSFMLNHVCIPLLFDPYEFHKATHKYLLLTSNNKLDSVMEQYISSFNTQFTLPFEENVNSDFSPILDEFKAHTIRAISGIMNSNLSSKSDTVLWNQELSDFFGTRSLWIHRLLDNDFQLNFVIPPNRTIEKLRDDNFNDIEYKQLSEYETMDIDIKNFAKHWSSRLDLNDFKHGVRSNILREGIDSLSKVNLLETRIRSYGRLSPHMPNLSLFSGITYEYEQSNEKNSNDESKEKSTSKGTISEILNSANQSSKSKLEDDGLSSISPFGGPLGSNSKSKQSYFFEKLLEEHTDSIFHGMNYDDSKHDIPKADTTSNASSGLTKKAKKHSQSQRLIISMIDFRYHDDLYHSADDTENQRRRSWDSSMKTVRSLQHPWSVARSTKKPHISQPCLRRVTHILLSSINEYAELAKRHSYLFQDLTCLTSMNVGDQLDNIETVVRNMTSGSVIFALCSNAGVSRMPMNQDASNSVSSVYDGSPAHSDSARSLSSGTSSPNQQSPGQENILYSPALSEREMPFSSVTLTLSNPSISVANLISIRDRFEAPLMSALFGSKTEKSDSGILSIICDILIGQERLAHPRGSTKLKSLEFLSNQIRDETKGRVQQLDERSVNGNDISTSSSVSSLNNAAYGLGTTEFTSPLYVKRYETLITCFNTLLFLALGDINVATEETDHKIQRELQNRAQLDAVKVLKMFSDLLVYSPVLTGLRNEWLIRDQYIVDNVGEVLNNDDERLAIELISDTHIVFSGFRNKLNICRAIDINSEDSANYLSVGEIVEETVGRMDFILWLVLVRAQNDEFNINNFIEELSNGIFEDIGLLDKQGSVELRCTSSFDDESMTIKLDKALILVFSEMIQKLLLSSFAESNLEVVEFPDVKSSELYFTIIWCILALIDKNNVDLESNFVTVLNQEHSKFKADISKTSLRLPSLTILDFQLSLTNFADRFSFDVLKDELLCWISIQTVIFPKSKSPIEIKPSEGVEYYSKECKLGIIQNCLFLRWYKQRHYVIQQSVSKNNVVLLRKSEEPVKSGKRTLETQTEKVKEPARKLRRTRNPRNAISSSDEDSNEEEEEEPQPSNNNVLESKMVKIRHSSFFLNYQISSNVKTVQQPNVDDNSYKLMFLFGMKGELLKDFDGRQCQHYIGSLTDWFAMENVAHMCQMGIIYGLNKFSECITESTLLKKEIYDLNDSRCDETSSETTNKNEYLIESVSDIDKQLDFGLKYVI